MADTLQVLGSWIGGGIKWIFKTIAIILAVFGLLVAGLLVFAFI